MTKRINIVSMPLIVVVLLLVAWSFFEIRNYHVKQQYVRAATECSEAPSSNCVAGLAVLRLPKVLRWDDFARRDLRQLGYGTVVDERLLKKEASTIEIDKWRRADEAYDTLIRDIDAFTALPAMDVHTLSRVADRLQHDYPDMNARRSGVQPAEAAVLARRTREYQSPRYSALIDRWQDAMDDGKVHCRSRLEFANRARELGYAEHAKSTLSSVLDVCPDFRRNTSLLLAMWRLYDAETVLAEVNAVDDSVARANIAILLAEHALDAGYKKDGRAFFDIFAVSLADVAPEQRDDAYADLLYRAGSLLIRLGDTVAARQYAVGYADWIAAYDAPEYSAYMAHSALPEPLAAELLAAVGATERAIMMTDEMLARLPEPQAYEGNYYWAGQDDAPPFIEAIRMFERAGAIDKAIAAADEAVRRAPPPGLDYYPLVWGPPKFSVDNYSRAAAAGVTLRCRLGRIDKAIALIDGSEEIGYLAQDDCLAELQRQNPTLDFKALADTLSLHSSREMEIGHATRLVATGSYGAASEFIRTALSSPPIRPADGPGADYLRQNTSYVRRNLPYLKLAIMMRNDELIADVTRYIVQDSVESREADVWTGLATMALIIRKWSENQQD